MNMKISAQNISQRFPTNGVLRCLCGEFPTLKTEKGIQDASDVLETVQKVFNYSDNVILDIVKSRNLLSTFLVPISAGRHLEEANPWLKDLRVRLNIAAQERRIETEINQIVSEVGENINLKA